MHTESIKRTRASGELMHTLPSGSGEGKNLRWRPSEIAHGSREGRWEATSRPAHDVYATPSPLLGPSGMLSRGSVARARASKVVSFAPRPRGLERLLE